MHASTARGSLTAIPAAAWLSPGLIEDQFVAAQYPPLELNLRELLSTHTTGSQMESASSGTRHQQLVFLTTFGWLGTLPRGLQREGEFVLSGVD